MEYHKSVNLAKAIPDLEKVIVNHPDQHENDLSAVAQTMADEFQLDDSQTSLLRRALSQYRQDRSAIWKYYGLLTGEEIPQEGKNPIAVIDAVPQLKIAALADFGVDRRRIEEGALEKFSLDPQFPPALITHFRGGAGELSALFGDEGVKIENASGFYMKSLQAEEGESVERINLLSGRLLFVTHPDPEEQRRFINSPEQTKGHEIRHYLFQLFWGLGGRDDVDYCMTENVLDEMQARMGSGQWYVQLDDLLQGESHFLSKYPEATEQMVDFLYEMERLAAYSSGERTLAANTVLTSSDLPEATKRLSTLGEKGDRIDVYRRLLGLTTKYNDSGDFTVDGENNRAFIRAVVGRVFDGCANDLSISDESLATFTSSLAHALREQIFMGTSGDGSITRMQGLIQEITTYRNDFSKKGLQVGTLLDSVLEKARDEFEDIRGKTVREKSRLDFGNFLNTEHPFLSAELSLFSGRSTIGDRIKKKKFVQEHIEPIYREWITGREQDYLD